MNPKVKFLTLAALLIAVGVLLPMVFHMLSFGGPMFFSLCPSSRAWWRKAGRSQEKEEGKAR